jgi:hypothetical protein
MIGLNGLNLLWVMVGCGIDAAVHRNDAAVPICNCLRICGVWLLVSHLLEFLEDFFIFTKLLFGHR